MERVQAAQQEQDSVSDYYAHSNDGDAGGSGDAGEGGSGTGSGGVRMRKCSQALVTAKSLPKLIAAAMDHVQELARELDDFKVCELRCLFTGPGTF